LDEQQRQHILDPAKIAAGGVAAPVAALLTSRFGVTGTMIGLAASAVVATTVSDILKTYLQRASGTVRNIPGSTRTRLSSNKSIRGMVTAPFSWFLSLSPSRRRAMLLSSIVAGVIAFLIGTSAVTALEVGAGKNLSCWVWNECSTQSSTGEQASSTLPSIVSVGQHVASSNAPQQQQQQPTAGSQSPSSQSSGTPVAKTPASSSQPDQQRPSEAPQAQQQSSSPDRVVEEQQQSSSSDATGEQQSSSSRITEDQQQSPSSIPDSEVGSPQENSNTQ
jgi:hypothetical protein